MEVGEGGSGCFSVASAREAIDAVCFSDAFGASDHGVFVSNSAGNGGPCELTVTKIASRVTIVGAGVIYSDFPADVKLRNGKLVPGVSVYGGLALAHHCLYPLIYAGTEGGDDYSASLCLEAGVGPPVSSDQTKFSGNEEERITIESKEEK
ncbi:hypothetical protein L1887_35558 [Cichorium endivia]|nr:hypothetical protein L1887_35558 [Cichorium endivia]